MNMYGGYGPVLPPKNTKKQQTDKAPTFKVLTDPATLDKLEIVWNIALHC